MKGCIRITDKVYFESEASKRLVEVNNVECKREIVFVSPRSEAPIDKYYINKLRIYNHQICKAKIINNEATIIQILTIGTASRKVRSRWIKITEI